MRTVFVFMFLAVSGCGAAIEDAIEEGRREAAAAAAAAEKEAMRRDDREQECITSARQLVGENLGGRQVEFPGSESVTLRDDGSWVVDGVVTLVDDLVRQNQAFVVASDAAGKVSVEVAEPVSNASPDANDSQESAIESIRESGGTVSSRGHEVRMPVATDVDLAPLRQLPGLTHLYLDDTKITDAGLVYLSQASRLSTLSLENTAVTDKGLAHLRGLPLTFLDLRGTAVSDGGVTHLATLKNMFVLRVDDSAISEQGMKELGDALPRCKVMTGR